MRRLGRRGVVLLACASSIALVVVDVTGLTRKVLPHPLHLLATHALVVCVAVLVAAVLHARWVKADRVRYLSMGIQIGRDLEAQEAGQPARHLRVAASRPSGTD